MKATRQITKLWTHGELGTVSADVHVLLDDGRAYVTTFCTPDALAASLRVDVAGMRYPYSEYLADPYVVVVSRLDLDLFRDITDAMLAEGTFHAFYQLAET